MLRPFQRPDRSASSIAAAMLVMVQALTGIAFILVLISDNPDRTFLIIAGAVLLIGLLAIWLHNRPSIRMSDAMGWVFSRKARPERYDYQLSRKPVSLRRFGTKTPPSVDQIREIKEETRTCNWVPAQQVSSRGRTR